MNVIILNKIILFVKMSINQFTAKQLYEDFIQYATENDIIQKSIDVHEAYLRYYDAAIENTDKHDALFKHFFPKKKKYDSLKLSIHMYKITMTYIRENNCAPYCDEME